MKIILDECLPKRLMQEFPEHDITTVPQQGWSSISNGELLKLVEQGFDVFLTGDGNLSYQQNLKNLRVAIVVFSIRSNRFKDLRQYVP